MSWLQAHTVVDRQRAPRFELLFQHLGALSVTLGDAEDELLLEPAPGEAPLWSKVRVTGLFPADTDTDRLRTAFDQSTNVPEHNQLQLETLEDQAWERAWLDDFHPMQFGQRLWICPAGKHPASARGVFIDLDPGLAFGTGTHPTTALCLEWLDKTPLKGLKILDLGCGSGILAIAALKLGARQVLAVDHDPQALDATQRNATKNGVAQRLTLTQQLTRDSRQFDLILANILAGTLIQFEPILAATTRIGGTILLSGVLQQQAAKVSAAYAPHFQMSDPVPREEWVLIEGRRR